MLRRLIDVLCIAVVAAVIVFAVMGRDGYVSALNSGDNRFFVFPNISNGTVGTVGTVGSNGSTETAGREPLSEEHIGKDNTGLADSPIHSDDITSAADTKNFSRYGRSDDPTDPCEYIEGPLNSTDRGFSGSAEDDAMSDDARSGFEEECIL